MKRRLLSASLSLGAALVLVPPMAFGLGTTRDAELASEIRERLHAEPILGDADVEVRVRSGIVSLSGSVGLFSHKMLIAQLANRSPSIVDISNEVVVRPNHPRSDAEIERALIEIWKHDPGLRGRLVEFRVRDGAVRVSAMFLEPEEMDRFKRNAGHVVGVIDLRVDAEVVV